MLQRVKIRRAVAVRVQNEAGGEGFKKVGSHQESEGACILRGFLNTTNSARVMHALLLHLLAPIDFMRRDGRPIRLRRSPEQSSIFAI